MTVGDLVVATHDIMAQPTFWYREMLDTGRSAVVVAIHDTPHGQRAIEIYYDGEKRFAMEENMAVVSGNANR